MSFEDSASMASNDAYDRKFAEMQKYIPFLENMIDRLKQAQEKPRAAQLDKIQSLYNIVTNTKKKLKYETLIKCEEGLQKLYNKVEKTAPLPTLRQESGFNPENPIAMNSAEKIINDLKLRAARLKVKQIDFASAPASPSPPNTPDPLPSKPILIPTERKRSPVSKAAMRDDWHHLNQRNHHMYYPGDSGGSADPKYELYQRREQPWQTVVDYGHRKHKQSPIPYQSGSDNYKASSHKPKPGDSIYKNAIINRPDVKDLDKDERMRNTEGVLLSPPPVDPPLSSADIENLLSETVAKDLTQDISELESLRAQLVSEIENLPAKKHSSKKNRDEPHKHSKRDSSKDPPKEKHKSSRENEGNEKHKNKHLSKEKMPNSQTKNDSSKSSVEPALKKDLTKDSKGSTSKDRQDTVDLLNSIKLPDGVEKKGTTTTVKDAAIAGDDSKLKSKSSKQPERVIREADNIFGNLLCSIDEKILDQKKKDAKKCDVSKKDKHESKSSEATRKHSDTNSSKLSDHVKHKRKSVSKDDDKNASLSKSNKDSSCPENKDRSKLNVDSSSKKDKVSEKNLSIVSESSKKSDSSDDNQSNKSLSKVNKSKDNDVKKPEGDRKNILSDTSTKGSHTEKKVAESADVHEKLIPSGNAPTENPVDNNPSTRGDSSSFVRLADKYQRRPKVDKDASKMDIHPFGDNKHLTDIDERIKPPMFKGAEASFQNFTGRGLTTKELERFGAITNSIPDICPPNNEPKTWNMVNDPRLLKRGQILHQPPMNIITPPWQQGFIHPPQQSPQNPPNHPLSNPPMLSPQHHPSTFNPGGSNFYDSRQRSCSVMPPMTPMDPFNEFDDSYSSGRGSRDNYSGCMTPQDPFSNMQPERHLPSDHMNNVRIPPNMSTNFGPNRMPNQFNHNMGPGQYDLAQIGPIDYYDAPGGGNQFMNRPPHGNPSMVVPPMQSPPNNSRRFSNVIQSNNFKNSVGAENEFNHIPHSRRYTNQDMDRRRDGFSRKDFRNYDSRDPRRRYNDSSSQRNNDSSSQRNNDSSSQRNNDSSSQRNKKDDGKFSSHRNNSDKKFRGYDPRPKPRKKDPEPSVNSTNVDVPVEGAANTKPVGLQSFKIPKLKRDTPPVVTEIKKDHSLKEGTEIVEINKEIKVEVKSEVKIDAPVTIDTQNPEVSSNTDEYVGEISPKVKIEPKEAIINEFVRKLCETGETDSFFAVLERLGDTLNKKKFKRLKRIFDSDSEGDSDTEPAKDEPVKIPPGHKVEPSTDQALAEETTKTVPGDSIEEPVNSPPNVRKMLRREAKNKAKINLCETSKQNEDDAETETTKPKRPKRRNALEMLQDDIRDMFICKGVLTATGQRMCRILKEDQDGKSTPSDADSTSSECTQKKTVRTPSESSESYSSLRKTRSSNVIAKKLAVEEVVVGKRRVPRVLLEKTVLPKVTMPSNENSSDETTTALEDMTSMENSSPKKKNNKTGKKIRAKKEIGEYGWTDADSVISEVSSIDGGRAQIFIKRNLRSGKQTPKVNKLRSRKTIKTKISDVVIRLFRNTNADLDSIRKKDLNAIFDGSLSNEETVKTEMPDDSVELAPRKRGQGRKKNTKKRKRWSTGVIKKKPGRKLTQNEDKKEEEIAVELIATPKQEEEKKVEEAVPEESIDYCDKSYCLSGVKKYRCKLCPFSGKTIVSHYKACHPDSEVLISRLPESVVEICIQQSKEKDYENYVQVEEILRCKEYRRKRFAGFCCRFCDILIKDDFAETFYDHIASHTGEDRFGCPKCSFTSNTKASIRCHVLYSHRGTKFTDISKSCGVLYEGYKNVPIVFGYVCEVCNFTQLHKENMDQHVERRHPGRTVPIFKINLSSIATEVTEKFKYEAYGRDASDSTLIVADEKLQESDASEVEPPAEPKIPEVVPELAIPTVLKTEDTSEVPISTRKDNSDMVVETPNIVTEKKSTDVNMTELDDETNLDSLPVFRITETLASDDSQKELDLTVFVCRENVLDEQKIQDERLRKMQEIAETLHQPRRPTFRFLDSLKSKLESSTDEPSSSDDLSESQTPPPAEPTVDPPSDDALLEKTNAVTSEFPSVVPDISLADITTELDDAKETTTCEPSQILDNEQLDAELIDDVLNLESDWSKWTAASKQNNAIMNTIQRLTSVVKQSNETTESSETETPGPSTMTGPSKDVIVDVGPITARKLETGVLFFCSNNKCSFSTEDQDTFQNHITSEHSKVVWDGDCNECDQIVDMDVQRLFTTNALIHLLDTHMTALKNPVKVTPPLVSPTDAVSKPIIRMRRLSGDKLSATGAELPQEIMDAVLIADDTDQKKVPSTPPPLVAMQIANIRTLSPNSEILSPSKSTGTPVTCISSGSSQEENSPAIPQVMPMLIPFNIVSPPIADPITPPSRVTKLLKILPKMNTFAPETTFKDPEALTKMLVPYKLCHFFKCMMRHCSYSSNTLFAFLWHLKTKIDSLSVNQWAICPYCDVAGIVNTTQLFNHMLLEHGECRYQCAYCFYRAASQGLVERHQFTVHKKEYRIYTLPIRDSYNTYKKQLRLEVICQPYICCVDGCRAPFYVKDHYLNHYQKVHPTFKAFKCMICDQQRDDGPTLVAHYTCHKIGLMQCLYCDYTAEYPDTARAHMSAWHPNQIPKVLIRELNPALTNKYKESLEESSEKIIRDLVIRDLDLDAVHNSTPITIQCVESLSSPVSATSSPPNPSYGVKFVPVSGDRVPAVADSTNNSHIDVVELSDDCEDLNDLIETTLKETDSIDKLSSVNIDAIFTKFRDKEDSAPSTPKSSEPDIPLIDIVISDLDEERSLTSKSISSPVVVSTEVDPLGLDSDIDFTPSSTSNLSENTGNIVIKDILTITNSQEKSDTENDSNSLDLSVDDDSGKPSQLIDVPAMSVEAIMNSGLMGKALYRCGNDPCDFRAANMSDFRDHLILCAVSKISATYKCFHCKRTMRQVNSLVDHIKTHGVAKYGCSLCPYRGPLSNYVSKHMRTKHKIAATRTVAVKSTDENHGVDLFVVFPHDKSVKTLKRKDSNKDIPPNPNPIESTESKMVFGPGEIDLLPRQPISPFHMKCSVCSYLTKVRTNMVRHLLFHSNSVAVPESAPVNPVPCLETNEKMFDKMVNLANSSFAEIARMGGKKGDKTPKKETPELSTEEKNSLPAFVPQNKRFVCGANGCTYLTVNESMLRCHFQALHTDELSYKCPHCNELVTDVSIERIGFHLKMHGSKLYKCGHCTYYHYSRKILERHLSDKHADKVPHVHVVREEDSETNKEVVKEPEVVVECPDAPKDFKPWRCGLCKYRAMTKTDVVEHANSNHGVRSQFKCGLCSFKNSYDKNFESHFDSKHPGQKVDMISVFYKEECPPVVEPPETDQFDTTPIWLRDMPRVRHIRGILFEDMKSAPKKSVKPPEVVKVAVQPDSESEPEEQDWGEINKCKTNKMAGGLRRTRRSTVTCQTTGKDVPSDELKSHSSDTTLEIFNFICRVCDQYKCKSERQLTEHLCVEMMYEKFGCTCCTLVSHSYDSMKDHVEKTHTKPDPEAYIAILTEDKQIETFILEKINEQRKLVPGNLKDRKTFNELIGFDVKTNYLTVQRTSEEEDVVVDEDSNPLTIVETTPKKVAIIIDEQDFIDPRQTDRNMCPHCPYGSKYPRDVTKHIVRHWIKQPYQCGICGLTGNRSSEILKHSIAQHPSQQSTLIQLCDPKNIPVRPISTKKKRKICVDEVQSNAKKVAMDNVSAVEDKITPVTPQTDSGINNVITSKQLWIPPKVSPSTDMISESSDRTTQDNTDSEGTTAELNTTQKSALDGDDGKMDVLYLCQFCPKRGDTVSEIYDHWLLIHKGTKTSMAVFKFRTMARNKLPVRGRIMCMYCGFRGSKQLIYKHQKTVHAGKKMYTSISPSTKPNIKIDCVNCSFYAYNVSILKWHFKEEHPTVVFENLYADEIKCDETKIENDLPFSESDMKNMPYQCKWCMEVCKDKETANLHHATLHAHLVPTLELMRSNSTIKYSCPECQHCTESYTAILDHIRSHAKPYTCAYCDAQFRFPGQVKHHSAKEHEGMEPKHIVVTKSQQILNDLKNNLNIVLEDGSLVKYAEYKKWKRPLSESATQGPPAKVPKLEVMSSEQEPVDSKVGIVLFPEPTVTAPKVKNCAKKSTTYVPASIVCSTARKSTSPFPRKTVDSPLPAVQPPVQEFSFYGCVDDHDNSNITTTMYLGGTQMKVHIKTLMQLTNIFPKVLVKDLKKQKMGL